MSLRAKWKLTRSNHRRLSLVPQCHLVHQNLSGLYYKKVGELAKNRQLMKIIAQLFTTGRLWDIGR